jgi:hypothetical protein
MGGPRAGTNEVGHSSYGTTRITGCEDSRQQPAQSTDSSVSRHVSERNERLVVFCSDNFRSACPLGPSPMNSENHASCSISSCRMARTAHPSASTKAGERRPDQRRRHTPHQSWMSAPICWDYRGIGSCALNGNGPQQRPTWANSASRSSSRCSMAGRLILRRCTHDPPQVRDHWAHE